MAFGLNSVLVKSVIHSIDNCHGIYENIKFYYAHTYRFSDILTALSLVKLSICYYCAF